MFNLPIGQWSDSAVSNCLMVGQCCVQLSNGRTVLCTTVQWSDSAVSNCQMVGQCCVQLSNGRTVLCPTVQWLDSAVFNCPMVEQCCVKLPNGWTVLCPIIQWSDSPFLVLQYNFDMCNEKTFPNIYLVYSLTSISFLQQHPKF